MINNFIVDTMLDSKTYSNKLRDIGTKTQNKSLKSLSNAMGRLMENSSENGIQILNTYLREASSIEDLTSDEKRDLTIGFKEIPILDMGLKESVERISEDSEHMSDPTIQTKMATVRNMVGKNKDYHIVESVIGIYKSFPECEVIQEQIELLENNLTDFRNDVKVLNIIDYIKSSKDHKKHKETSDSCIVNLEDYLADPNAYTRAEAIECLRDLSYDSRIKEFLNYLTTLNFADDTYNHSVPVKGSPIAGRVYSGGYLEKWHKDKETKGLGQLMVESIEQAIEIGSEINPRVALKLLVESFSDITMNSVERHISNKFIQDYSIFDMGLVESIEDIKNNTYLGSNIDIKKCIDLVESAQKEGQPEYKIVENVFYTLSKYEFEPVVANHIEKIKQRYNSVEERVILEKVKDYVSSNPRMGMYKTLNEDINNYIESPSRKKKHDLVNKYTKLSLDNYVAESLKNITNINNTISNPSSKDFILSKVYSIVESTGNKHYFMLNGKCLSKKGDDIQVISEENAPKSLLNKSMIMESLNISVVDDWTVRGYVGGMSMKIDIDESTGSKFLYLNNSLVENRSSKDILRYVMSQNVSSDKIEGMFDIYENVDSIVELDFITRISTKSDSNVYADLIKCNETYYINFVNNNIGLNKFVKTKKASTLRAQLYEYMEFDITNDISDLLLQETSQINEMKKQANVNLQEIELCESKLEKLKYMDVSSLPENSRMDLFTIIENLESEIADKKKSYASLISKITESEDNESNVDDVEDDKEKDGKKEDDDTKDDEIPISAGDKISHKPSKKTGEVTACNNKKTCTVKFSDGTIQTVKIDDCSKIEKYPEEGKDTE